MSEREPLSIVICSHGDRRGQDRDRHLYRLQEDIQKLVPDVEIVTARLSQEDELETAIHATIGEIVCILPIFFSDGYFYNKIKQVVEGSDRDCVIVPPLAEWPELCELIDKKVTDEAPVVLIAHGSQKSSASRDSTERVRNTLSRCFKRKVDACYLEEPPFAEEFMSARTEAVCVVGLFFGQGLHGKTDFQDAVSAPIHPVLDAFVVGELQELAELCANKAIEATQINLGN